MSATTVLVVDDQDLIRMGNCLVLDSAPDIRVIGEASDGASAIAAARDLLPDIVLMDARMPGIDGIEATRRIVDDHPRTRVIVLTTFDLDEYAFGALRAGASAFLIKSARPDVIVDAVRTVAAGSAVVSPRLTRQLIDHFLTPEQPAVTDGTDDRLDPLTPRELDVLEAIARGWTNSEIAVALHLAPSSVKSYVNIVFSKLHLRDRVHAVLIARECGLPRD